MGIHDYLDLISTLFLKRFSDWFYLVVAGFLVLVLAIALHRRNYSLKFAPALLRSLATNAAFWWGNIVFIPFVLLAYQVVEVMYEKAGIPQLDEAVWEGVPLWLLAIVATVFKDFADYWNHRALHHKWLWPIHSIHHSDTALNPLTTYRVHFLEPLVMTLSYLLILGWFGIPDAAVAFGSILVTLHNMYVHTNVDWGHGRLKYIVASPRMHQWHHADVTEAHGKNLANIFPVFDLMFGTYYVPGPCTEPLGAQGVPETGFVKLSFHPFVQWSRAFLQPFRSAGPVKKPT